MRSAIRSIPRSSAGTAGSGTATSSSSVAPRRSSAGKASRRAAISIRPSASSSVVTARSAPASSQSRAIAAISSAPSTRPASLRAKSIASASRSSSIGCIASTAPIVVRSISSSIDGRWRRQIAAIAWPASSSRGKLAASVCAAGGVGSNRTVASVITASVPSLPQSSPARSYPATPLRVACPTRRISPLARTASSASTASRVTPYFTQQSPPALVATLPPIVENSKLAGSGAYSRPSAAAASRSVRLTTPAWTVAVSAAGSRSTIVVIRSSDSTRQPSIALAPPLSPEPAPRGTTGTPTRPAATITPWTSAVVVGRATAAGVPAASSPGAAWSWR